MRLCVCVGILTRCEYVDGVCMCSLSFVLVWVCVCVGVVVRICNIDMYLGMCVYTR